MSKTILYRYRCMIQRGNRFIGHPGYSEDSPEGKPTYPLLTKSECRMDAAKRGAVAIFDERHP